MCERSSAERTPGQTSRWMRRYSASASGLSCGRGNQFESGELWRERATLIIWQMRLPSVVAGMMIVIDRDAPPPYGYRSCSYSESLRLARPQLSWTMFDKPPGRIPGLPEKADQANERVAGAAFHVVLGRAPSSPPTSFACWHMLYGRPSARARRLAGISMVA